MREAFELFRSDPAKRRTRKAKDADGVIQSLKQVKIGEGGDVSASKPVMLEAPSVIEQMLKQVVHPPEDDVATEFAPEAKPH